MEMSDMGNKVSVNITNKRFQMSITKESLQLWFGLSLCLQRL